MSIEKDIKTKFRDEWHKASVNIIFAANWVLEQQKKHFDRANLTPQQYNMLRILKGSPTPLSTLQIRERMLDKMSDTSRIVDRLVAKELVKKEVNKADKRLVDVTISIKGRELIDWMDNYAYEIDDVMKNLSEQEAYQLNILLDKARKKLEE
jgi:DNA-binding MarR family transcriptional regulator